MALHPVKVFRGPDITDGQDVAVLLYRLPDGQEGLVVIDQIEILGQHMLTSEATDEQIIDRFKAYAGRRPFIIDLLNEQHHSAAPLAIQTWLKVLTPIYEGQMYLFGIDNEE